MAYNLLAETKRLKKGNSMITYITYTCNQCKADFKRSLRNNSYQMKTNLRFCSKSCHYKYKKNPIKVKCTNCNKEFEKTKAEIGINNFCCRSCSAIYRNAHKTSGFRRSKLEVWLESQLKTIYPNLNILFNNRTTINSELDIYIPSLKLAFELNGIFHYEPIYGQNKLDQTQNNDNRKFQACAENNISLCIIDTSKQKYFKESTSKQFLDIIISIINQAETEDAASSLAITPDQFSRLA